MKNTDVLPGGDQSALRHLNTSRILQLLYEGPPLAINTISQVTALSRPTVRGIVGSLVEAGRLTLAGQDTARTGGRPAQRYAFDDNAGRLAGVHIDAHGIAVRITDLSGTELTTAHRETPTPLDADERLRAAADLVREQLPAGGSPLWAVGVGTPGIVDAEGAVRLSVAIPQWSGVRLADRLAELLGRPVVAMKDTNLAVLAEHRVGAARGTPDVLYVHMSNRLGVGILVDGRPFTGRTGAAGEIGRHPGLGWNETPARLRIDAGTAHDDTEEAARLVFARARHGDPTARTAVDAYVRALAAGIGAMVLAVDPQLIVLGGSLSGAGPDVLEAVRHQLTQVCYEVPPLTLTALSEDAVSVGGVEAARDLVRDRLFSAEPRAGGPQN
ncbi:MULTISPECIES: ROK family transcriptional regulator [unclassified Streptomyces]|uniref:ROK family transcriptional regulator n=1 Tax=unclassified Streptomyces TaxID=2593676 RepID=UPI0022500BED|nr:MULTISPECIES: ROK family transcriptional regulator [unclassified Streptomyces]WSP55742.1 ROK family transcriptional regulator [Streptomyces sp. NBC_01241]WSU23522.1 ROK family transcriptional regulator [Streptomyces sp. NBC_01108]MCX4787447.1 ROK family transcriptional regulator [Streptomyces sp. NBC_01221]MCX4796768.1 ROK family transcriptional regulator [Streptomyces sp. NBC_01242]WSP64393.1 ROK family transcriptional regulator [Streptomyces sp. NBC_01240]